MRRLPFIKSLAVRRCPASRQQGGMLIESLIGMLILGLIGGGLMHATARMTATQRDMTMNHLTVSQMRTLLMNRSSAGADLCTGNHTIALPGQAEPLAITVKGCAVAPAKINGIKIGGTLVAEQSLNSLQPLVLEVGEGDALVRLGGAVANAN